VLLFGLWVLIKKHRLDYSDVGFSYDLVVQRRELWRLLASQLSHIEFVHLLFNLAALWPIGVVEADVSLVGGSSGYLRVTVHLILLTGLAELALHHVAVSVQPSERLRSTVAVGYSGVVFAWQTLMAARFTGPGSRYLLLGLLPLPMWLAPLASLLLVQLLVPTSSVVGHTAGVLAGLVAAVGLMDWLDSYWTVCALMWVAIGMAWMMLRDGALHYPYLRLLDSGTTTTSTVPAAHHPTSPGRHLSASAHTGSHTTAAAAAAAHTAVAGGHVDLEAGQASEQGELEVELPGSFHRGSQGQAPLPPLCWAASLLAWLQEGPRARP